MLSASLPHRHRRKSTAFGTEQPRSLGGNPLKRFLLQAFCAAVALGLLAAPARAVPVIFHSTETAVPGDVIGLQGDGFGMAPQVWMQRVAGTEASLSPQIQLTVLNKVTDKYVSAVIPSTQTLGLYAVWVKNGTSLSSTQYINRARAWNANDLCGVEVDPNRSFRLFGRNLYFPGSTPTVTFTAGTKSLSATVTTTGSDAYVLNATAPAGVVAGTAYAIRINNGLGGSYGNSDAGFTLTGRAGGTDAFGLGVPWGADFTFSGNQYNVKTDSRLSIKAMGNGVANDAAAIQNAIQKARDAGGGVVYFPSGTYLTVMHSVYTNVCLSMRENVVFRGDGMDASTIVFTGGVPGSEAQKGLECQSNGRIGFVDIGFYNTLTGGNQGVRVWGGSDRVFALRTKFKHDIGRNIWWRYGSRYLLRDCSFVQNGTTNGWDCVIFNTNTHVVFRNNTVSWCFGRMRTMESVKMLIENNHCTRIGINNGFASESGGFDVSGNDDIVLLNNTLDKGGSDPITQTNDGEAILCQEGLFHQDVGTVTSAASSTLTDSTKSWTFNYSNPEADRILKYSVAIVNGPGMGQSRRILSGTSNTLTMEYPWSVTPTNASNYTIAFLFYRCLLKGNVILQHPQGIQLGDMAMQDVVVANNTQTDCGMWFDEAWHPYAGRPRFNVGMEYLITGNLLNTVYNWYNEANSFARFILSVRLFSTPLGTNFYVPEFRNNTIVAPIPNRGNESFLMYNESGSGTQMAILGAIYQGNKTVNTGTAYTFSTPYAYCTVVWDAILQNVTSFISNAGVSTVTGPAAPRGLYAFDGNANDTSGGGKNGTNYGATFVTGTVGSQAAKFNGTTAYIRIPRTISTDFSIACWVKTNAANYGSGQWYNGKGLIDGYVSASANDFGTAVVAGKFALGVGNPKTTLSSAASINNGVWHHVAATRDSASGQMRVYVDGALSNSRATGPTGAKTAPPYLRIGSLQTGASGKFLNGTIDDARVYNYVLSASEVAALYTH